MPRKPSVPKPYEKSGQLVVCLRDPHTGCRRTVYLGPSESVQARQQYARVLAEWEAGDRVVKPPKGTVIRKAPPPDAVSIAEVVLAYFRAIKSRHSDGGRLTAHGHSIRNALRCLREEAGDLAAIDFGPKALKTVRAAMVDSGRFNRGIVNKKTRYIVAAFKWAVAEELIPPRVYEALNCVEPIKRGEIAGLCESKVIRPVRDEVVAATPSTSIPSPTGVSGSLIKLAMLPSRTVTQIILDARNYGTR
ncbi:MAG: hypothetical protein AAF663_09030 [Planctomycetota bacterium]